MQQHSHDARGVVRMVPWWTGAFPTGTHRADVGPWRQRVPPFGVTGVIGTIVPRAKTTESPTKAFKLQKLECY